MEIVKQLSENPRTGLPLKAVFERINIAVNDQEVNVQFKIIEYDKEGHPYKPETSQVQSITTMPNTIIPGMINLREAVGVDAEKAKRNAEKLKAFNVKLLAFVKEELFDDLELE